MPGVPNRILHPTRADDRLGFPDERHTNFPIVGHPKRILCPQEKFCVMIACKYINYQNYYIMPTLRFTAPVQVDWDSIEPPSFSTFSAVIKDGYQYAFAVIDLQVPDIQLPCEECYIQVVLSIFPVGCEPVVPIDTRWSISVPCHPGLTFGDATQRMLLLDETHSAFFLPLCPLPLIREHRIDKNTRSISSSRGQMVGDSRRACARP
jgi:hypothetical protein